MSASQEWRKAILSELREVKQEVKFVAKELHQVNTQLNSLKVKVAGVSATVAILVTIITAMATK